MTSKISSNQSQDFNKLISVKLLRSNIRQNKILIIIAGILLFCARPLVQIISLMNYYNNPHMQRNISLYTFAHNHAVDTGALVTAVTLAMAIFSGISVTSYMHSKKAAIFYNSIPVKRLNLFATQYISGLAYFIPAFAASYILSMVIMPFRGAMFINTQFYLGALFFFLLIYSFTILCANIAGTIMNTLFAGFYFCAILPMLFTAFFGFADMFYRFTNVGGMMLNPFWEFIYYPVINYFPVVFQANRYLTVFDCVFMLIFAAAMTCLAYFFNRLTKVEHAEKPFYFEKFLAVFKYSALVVFGISAGMLFYMASGNNFPFIFIGIFIGGFLSFLFLNLLIYKSMREVFRGIKQFLIFAVCVSVISGIISFDILGIDRHIPEPSRVSSISYRDWNNILTYDFSFEFTHAPHRFYSSNYIVITDPEAIQLVNNIFEAALKSDRRIRTTGFNVSSSQENLPFRHRHGAIFYNLTNGGTWAKELDYFALYFRNQQDSDAFYDALRAFRDSAGYRQAFFYPLTDTTAMREHLNSSEIFNAALTQGDSLIFARDISRGEMETLISMLNTDIELLDMGEIWDWQYDLSLTFRRADGTAGGINIIINEQRFARTISFLFDSLN